MLLESEAENVVNTGRKAGKILVLQKAKLSDVRTSGVWR